MFSEGLDVAFDRDHFFPERRVNAEEVHEVAHVFHLDIWGSVAGVYLGLRLRLILESDISDVLTLFIGSRSCFFILLA